MDLPPGFRFHPMDEELITHYLLKKVVDSNFSAIAIADVDLNKVEPWELPWKATMGEKEWYFFCVRDKKYPTGMRTNRATAAGYWKATGKDKEIYKGKTLLVGMKKTLVFYKGRAPKGEKTNWVIHEYRLEGKISLQNLPKNAKEEWVICRVFHKSAGGKKIPITSLIRQNQLEYKSDPVLPPLVDPSPYTSRTEPAMSHSVHVSCFSNTIESHENFIFGSSSNPFPNPIHLTQIGLFQENLQQYSSSLPVHDQAKLRNLLVDYNVDHLKQNLKIENNITSISEEEGNASMVSYGTPVDFNNFWNY